MKKRVTTVKYVLFTTVLFLSAGAIAETGSTNHKHGEHVAAQETKNDLVREAVGTGVINNINEEIRVLDITHDPIQALSWPKMRMYFQAEKGVSLQNLKPGSEVHFTLVVDDDHNYRIKKIEPK